MALPSRRTLTRSLLTLSGLIWLVLSPLPAHAQGCTTADVVALDQPFWWNRLGAAQPQGMIYALRGDVVDSTTGSSCASAACSPGSVRLRSDKRPRPIVLRVNKGGCLEISFTNLLGSQRPEQPATRTASIHAMGLELMGDIGSDGSNVGATGSSLAAPGDTKTYKLYAPYEGTYLLYSTAATTGGEGDGGSLAAGLFGAVNVEPAGSEWYRSQVTADDVALATKGDLNGDPMYTAGGQPIIDYNAVYPAGHRFAGQPILKMTQGSTIVHSDLNAIITGPGAGRLAAGTYPANPVYPDREQPFREFTVIFHDEIGAVQAFPIFRDPAFKFTLHSVRDGFAINYGTGGVGAEIVANRLGLGPMKDCVECKYEEFFLTSWAVGDPAMVVDVPANASNPALGVVATKAFYPDDPSNVHHSYLNDHVKFRNLHAGPKEHHIFHLHAHQWLHTPDSPSSAYLDSQHIGPGSGFTYEITYNGSGNRNKTAGDSIFHCHFYPHFAQGMWELWRVHDVFESGTPLDGDGKPASGSRALPDGEILAGTPIPAVVPLPTLVMAPMPGASVQIVNGQAVVGAGGNPGYPFFVAGVAGHRPPHPPLDTVDDGGLPRHVIIGGTATATVLPDNFDKVIDTANAVEVPEAGTSVEQAAMEFHEQHWHSSFKPDGTAGSFETNGRPRQWGAPFADPCRNDSGQAVGTQRTYKVAALQTDVTINKAGWHFAQSRFLTLWDDVGPMLSGARAPEPLFFRANTNDCITFYHANLVPNVYEKDDFQVRTPTDIVGQHIHLVKFDVTSSDGSGNGWNYEDGSFSPGEVIERINAINAVGGSWNGAAGKLQPRMHPLGVAGAQTTVQRWYADAVLNNGGKDRTLRTVFSHDHYQPSTAQQAGLYSSLVVEPQGSSWRDPETGAMFGTRSDGGPTSWRADILTANAADSYREFLFQFADFQLSYRPDGTPVNPPGRIEVPLPFLQEPPRDPMPEAISADDVGTMTVNYRNEPIALRVRDPQTNTQAAGVAGDLAHAFRSELGKDALGQPILRADPAFNALGRYPPLTADVQPGDPFTPLMRAYHGDRVQVRVQVGATEESHNLSIHGVKWLYEPSDSNSGYRNSQAIGISEHFEFELDPLPPAEATKERPFVDSLYKVGSSVDDLWNGIWGILRSYDGGLGLRSDLLPLPSNSDGDVPPNASSGDFRGVCPVSAPVRRYHVVAVKAKDALPGSTLVYNSNTSSGGKLHDPTAILYVLDTDLDRYGKLKSGAPIEPLILRAAAGDCIEVSLQNKLGPLGDTTPMPDLDGFSTLPMIVDHFNTNQVTPSKHVGLTPQLVAHDVSFSDGANVGFNPVQTVPPGVGGKRLGKGKPIESIPGNYQWYAGNFDICEGTETSGPCNGKARGTRVATPVEFGAVNLMPADPIKHASKGAIGALVVEPKGSTWREDLTDSTKTRKTRDSATVTANGSTFRDFVLLFQDALNLRDGGNAAVPNTAEAEDPEDSGQKALNYRTEPLWKRAGFAPDTLLTGPGGTNSFDFTNVLVGEPVTPVFMATPGQEVRFRVLHPGGHARNHVFQLHGHGWQEEPYTASSTKLGYNAVSEWKGSQAGHGPTNHFDCLLKAGGSSGVSGDYLYRDQASFGFDGGLWGIFRVQ